MHDLFLYGGLFLFETGLISLMIFWYKEKPVCIILSIIISLVGLSSLIFSSAAYHYDTYWGTEYDIQRMAEDKNAKVVYESNSKKGERLVHRYGYKEDKWTLYLFKWREYDEYKTNEYDEYRLVGETNG